MMLHDELSCVHQAAQRAAEVQLNYAVREKQIDIKSDGSPVSQVDKKCEALIIEQLQSSFPRDAFLGEETGETAGQSGRTWIIDPLDGTRPYLKGIPIYSILIALIEDGQPVLGFMQLPGLNETYYATKGNGAYCNNQKIHVSNTNVLSAAYGSAYGHIPRLHEREGRATLESMHKWGFAMGFMDAYTYGCIASGKLDHCINLTDKPWDCASAACIIQEAGGRYSDIDGNESIYNGSFVISNGILHDELLANLRQ